MKNRKRGLDAMRCGAVLLGCDVGQALVCPLSASGYLLVFDSTVDRALSLSLPSSVYVALRRWGFGAWGVKGVIKSCRVVTVGSLLDGLVVRSGSVPRQFGPGRSWDEWSRPGNDLLFVRAFGEVDPATICRGKSHKYPVVSKRKITEV